MAWSPDSKWIAYTLTNKAYFQVLQLHSLEQGKSFPITDGLAEAHPLAPFRLAEGDERTPVVVVETEGDQIDLVRGPTGRVVDAAGADPVRVVAERPGRGEMPGPVAADLLV